jgi:hypothetical protein
MVINTTRFSPDTCQCVIDYDWDSESNETDRVHILKTFVNVCSAHASLPTHQDRWNAVFEENPRKNIAQQLIRDNAPSVLLETNQLGQTILKHFDISWSGTAPNRVLTITFTGISLTTQQKNQLQTFLNNRFGSGKVLIA